MHLNHRDDDFGGRALDLARREPWLELQVHAPAELRPLFDSLADLLGIMGYPRRDIVAVTLALHEAVTNAFRHGNRCDLSKSIHLRYIVTAAEVLIEVEDQGPGFDLGQVPNPFVAGILGRPAGRGLFLMRAYMTWLSFNRQGNRVTLFKERSRS